jgi:Protein of unknown function (DUF4087)
MRKIGYGVCLVLAFMSAAASGQVNKMQQQAHAATSATAKVLCGWYDNPSPQNAYLIDRTGEWVLSEMGGHQTEGDWNPNFKKSQWFLSGSGGYGYGCACMKVVTNKTSMQITRVLSAKARAIDACYFDKTLPKRKRQRLSPLDR